MPGERQNLEVLVDLAQVLEDTRASPPSKRIKKPGETDVKENLGAAKVSKVIRALKEAGNVALYRYLDDEIELVSPDEVPPLTSEVEQIARSDYHFDTLIDGDLVEQNRARAYIQETDLSIVTKLVWREEHPDDARDKRYAAATLSIPKARLRSSAGVFRDPSLFADVLTNIFKGQYRTSSAIHSVDSEVKIANSLTKDFLIAAINRAGKSRSANDVAIARAYSKEWLEEDRATGRREQKPFEIREGTSEEAAKESARLERQVSYLEKHLGSDWKSRAKRLESLLATDTRAAAVVYGSFGEEAAQIKAVKGNYTIAASSDVPSLESLARNDSHYVNMFVEPDRLDASRSVARFYVGELPADHVLIKGVWPECFNADERPKEVQHGSFTMVIPPDRIAVYHDVLQHPALLLPMLKSTAETRLAKDKTWHVKLEEDPVSLVLYESEELRERLHKVTQADHDAAVEAKEEEEARAGSAPDQSSLAAPKTVPADSPVSISKRGTRRLTRDGTAWGATVRLDRSMTPAAKVMPADPETAARQEILAVESLLERDVQSASYAFGAFSCTVPMMHRGPGLLDRTSTVQDFLQEKSRQSEEYHALFDKRSRQANFPGKIRFFVGEMDRHFYVKSVWQEPEEGDDRSADERFAAYTIFIGKDNAAAYSFMFEHPEVASEVLKSLRKENEDLKTPYGLKVAPAKKTPRFKFASSGLEARLKAFTSEQKEEAKKRIEESYESSLQPQEPEVQQSEPYFTDPEGLSAEEQAEREEALRRLKGQVEGIEGLEDFGLDGDSSGPFNTEIVGANGPTTAEVEPLGDSAKDTTVRTSSADLPTVSVPLDQLEQTSASFKRKGPVKAAPLEECVESNWVQDAMRNPLVSVGMYFQGVADHIVEPSGPRSSELDDLVFGDAGDYVFDNVLFKDLEGASLGAARVGISTYDESGEVGAYVVAQWLSGDDLETASRNSVGLAVPNSELGVVERLLESPEEFVQSLSSCVEEGDVVYDSVQRLTLDSHEDGSAYLEFDEAEDRDRIEEVVAKIKDKRERHEARRKNKINQYDIVGDLGLGGQASVYRARHTKLGVEHALKMMHVGEDNVGTSSQGSSSRAKLEEFENDAKFLAKLSQANPHIVPVHDFGVVDEKSDPRYVGQHFMAMELVEGGDLSDMLSRRDTCLDDVVDILIPVANALHASHNYEDQKEDGSVEKAEIVHRDVKPGNILLRKNKDAGGKDVVVPMLTDFGLARRFDEAFAKDKTAKDDLIAGTTSYMAPEQTTDPKSVDRRADVYALGAILYETVTGIRQFDDQPGCKDRVLGDTNKMILLSEGKVLPTPARELNADLDVGKRSKDDLFAIIDKAMSRDRKRRYQSARALADDLQNWKDRKFVTARTEHGLGERISDWWRNKSGRRKVVGALAAGVLGVAGVLGHRVYSDWQVREQEAAARAEAEERDRLARQSAYSGLRSTLERSDRRYDLLMDIPAQRRDADDVAPVVSLTRSSITEIGNVSRRFGLPDDLSSVPDTYRRRDQELGAELLRINERDRVENLRVAAYARLDEASLALGQLGSNPDSESVARVQRQFNGVHSALVGLRGHNIPDLESRISRVESTQSSLASTHLNATRREDVDSRISAARSQYDTLAQDAAPTRLRDVLGTIVSAVEQLPRGDRSHAYAREQENVLIRWANDVANRILTHSSHSSLSHSSAEPGLESAINLYAGEGQAQGVLAIMQRLDSDTITPQDNPNDSLVRSRTAAVRSRLEELRGFEEEREYRVTVNSRLDPIRTSYRRDSSSETSIPSLLASIVSEGQWLTNDDNREKSFAQSCVLELDGLVNQLLSNGLGLSSYDDLTVDSPIATLRSARSFYDGLNSRAQEWLRVNSSRPVTGLQTRVSSRVAELDRLIPENRYRTAVNARIDPVRASYRGQVTTPEQINTLLASIVSQGEWLSTGDNRENASSLKPYAQSCVDELDAMVQDLLSRGLGLSTYQGLTVASDIGTLRSGRDFYRGLDTLAQRWARVKSTTAHTTLQGRVDSLADTLGGLAQRSEHRTAVDNRTDAALSAYRRLDESANSKVISARLQGLIQTLPWLLQQSSAYATTRLGEVRDAEHDLLSRLITPSDSTFASFRTDASSVSVEALTRARVGYQSLESALDNWLRIDRSDATVSSTLTSVRDKVSTLSSMISAQEAYDSASSSWDIDVDTSTEDLVRRLTSINRPLILDRWSSSRGLVRRARTRLNEITINRYTAASAAILEEVTAARTSTSTALSRYQALLRADPGNSVAAARITELSGKQTELDRIHSAASRRSQTAEHVLAYINAFARNDFEGAIAALERARAIDPSSVYASLQARARERNVEYRAQVSAQAQEHVFTYQRRVRDLWDRYNSFRFVGDVSRVRSELDAYLNGRAASDSSPEVVGLRAQLQNLPADLRADYLARARVLAQQAESDSNAQYSLTRSLRVDLETHSAAVRELDRRYFANEIDERAYLSERARLRAENLNGSSRKGARKD